MVSLIFINITKFFCWYGIAKSTLIELNYHQNYYTKKTLVYTKEDIQLGKCKVFETRPKHKNKIDINSNI